MDFLNNVIFGMSKTIDLLEFLPKTSLNLNESRKQEFVEEVKKFYFQNREPSVEQMDSYIKLITDAWFMYGIQKAAKMYVAKAKSPLYFYRFSMDTKLNYIKNLHPKTATYSGNKPLNNNRGPQKHKSPNAQHLNIE